MGCYSIVEYNGKHYNLNVVGSKDSNCGGGLCLMDYLIAKGWSEVQTNDTGMVGINKDIRCDKTLACFVVSIYLHKIKKSGDLVMNTNNLSLKELIDIRDVKINSDDSLFERAKSFLKQIKDPYCFKFKNIIVTIEFVGKASLEDIMAEYLLNHKAE